MTGKKATGDKVLGQELLIEKLFHGSEAHDSYVHKLFMKGKGLFEMAFVKHNVENNLEGNEFRTDGNMHELRSQLHCDIASRCVLHQQGFTGEAICLGQGDKKLEGRNLNDRALLVVATLKFACRCCHDCLIECTGDNPSGLKLEDMLLFVRQQCFKAFKGKKNMKLCRQAKNAKEVSIDDMPNKHFFTGCFAFVLHGPHPISGTELECFSEDDSGPKKGRAASRKEEKEDKNKEREAAAGGYCPEDYRRGVNLRDKVATAQIAQAEVSEQNRNVRELLMATIEEHKATVQDLELVTRLVGTMENKEVFQKRLEEIISTLSELDKRKKRHRDESDRPLELNRNGKRQVNAPCDQVGTFQDAATTAKKVISVDDGVGSASPLTMSIDSPATGTTNDDA